MPCPCVHVPYAAGATLHVELAWAACARDFAVARGMLSCGAMLRFAVLVMVSASCATAPVPAPAPAVAPSAPAAPAALVAPPVLRHQRLATSENGFCQILASGALRCRELELEGLSPHEEPPTGTFTAIASTRAGYCALRTTGEVACWENVGAVGLQRLAFPGRYTQLVGDDVSLCALRVDGAMVCARPISQQGNTVEAPAIEMPGGPYRELFGQGACGISERGMRCFAAYGKPIGSNFAELAGTFVRAAGSHLRTCGLHASGELECTYEGRWRKDILPARDYVDVVVLGQMVCAKRPTNAWDCTSDVPAAAQPFAHAILLPMNAEGVRRWRSPTNDGFPIDERPALVGITPAGDLVFDGTADVRGGFVEMVGGASQCARRSDDTVHCSLAFHYDDDFVSGARTLAPRGRGFQTERGFVGWRPEEANGSTDRVFGRRPGKLNVFDARAIAPKKQVGERQYGYDHGCDLAPTGRITCWGEIMGSKRLVRPPTGTYSAMAIGAVAGCALTKSDGRIECWGSDSLGSLKFAPTDAGYVEISTDRLGQCAKHQSGAVRCWGGPFVERFELPFVPATFAVIAPGVCATERDGGPVRCFGHGVNWN